MGCQQTMKRHKLHTTPDMQQYNKDIRYTLYTLFVTLKYFQQWGHILKSLPIRSTNSTLYHILYNQLLNLIRTMKRISYVILTADLKIISAGLFFPLRQLAIGQSAVQVGRVDRWTPKHTTYDDEATTASIRRVVTVLWRVYILFPARSNDSTLHLPRGFEK